MRDYLDCFFMALVAIVIAAVLYIASGGPHLRSYERHHRYDGLMARGAKRNMVTTKLNREFPALASGVDAADGRTSDWLFNNGGSGIAVLLDVTAVEGTGQLTQLVVRTKNAAGSVFQVASVVFSSPITATGQYAFLLHPTSGLTAEIWTGVAITAIPRTFRVEISGSTAGAENANAVTYAVDIATIP